jgi:GAF domain-containing protein
MKRSEQPSREPFGVSLGVLVAVLGSDVIEVESAPHGLDHRVHEPVIFEEGVGQPLHHGDLLLAVNVSSDKGRAELLAEADAVGAAGVVFRHRPAGEGPRGQDAATPVLSIGPGLTWASLFSLLKSVIVETQPSGEDGDGFPRDLFSVADTAASLLDGAVSIYDPSMQHMLAYSSLGHPIDEWRRDAILGRGNTKDWVNQLRSDGVLARLWSDERAVHFSYPGVQRRMGVGIRSGDEVLGLLFVLEGDEQRFTAKDEEALVNAGRTAAHHLLRLRTAEAIADRGRSRLLHQILVGSWPGEVAAFQLGIDVGEANVIVGFCLGFDEQEMTLRRNRLQNLLMLYGRSVSDRAVSTSIGHVLYLLVPVGTASQRSQLAFVVQQIVDKANEILGLSLLAGVSSSVFTVGDLPRARGEADQVLEVLLEGRSDTRIATYDEAGTRIFLLEMQRLVGPQLARRASKIAKLLEHDAAHGTEFVSTLRAWLDAFGDANAVAEATHVHPNTVRHRLRRLAEIADLDLNDPTERFAVELQLRLGPAAKPPAMRR